MSLGVSLCVLVCICVSACVCVCVLGPSGPCVYVCVVVGIGQYNMSTPKYHAKLMCTRFQHFKKFLFSRFPRQHSFEALSTPSFR